MEIEITKRQETIDDVLKEPEYTLYIKRKYGNGDLQNTRTDWLYNFNYEDLCKLRDRLNKDFPLTL